MILAPITGMTQCQLVSNNKPHKEVLSSGSICHHAKILGISSIIFAIDESNHIDSAVHIGS